MLAGLFLEWQTDAEGSGLSYAEHQTGRALLTPDEVRTLPEQAQLLFIQGRRPVLARKLIYFQDLDFLKKSIKLIIQTWLFIFIKYKNKIKTWLVIIKNNLTYKFTYLYHG